MDTGKPVGRENEVDDDIGIVLHDAVRIDEPPPAKQPQPSGGYIAIGNPEKDDVKIFVEAEVISSLLAYAKTDTSRELGAILVGVVSEDKPISVFVDGVIEAKYTESVQASVKFTHQTWEYVNQVKDRDYPDKKIVGWFHTHPGFGIFLSSFDTFIHQNFFNLPWQIAYVIDPLSGREGFYYWRNGKIEKASGYYRRGTVQKSGPTDERASIPTPKQAFRIGVKEILIAVQFAVIILLVATRSTLPPTQPPPTPTYHEPEIATPPTPPSNSANSNSKYHYITVMNGDSLWSISKRVYGTGRHFNLIANANRLANPNVLYPGQRLLIPTPLPSEPNSPEK